MQSVSIVLIQVRVMSDPMARHEAACVQRRLEGLSVTLQVRNVFAEEPHVGWLRGADVVLIGGSGAYSVHDVRSTAWVDGLRRILDHALDRDMVGMGLCFGHQLLAHHFGGEVVTDSAAAEVGTIEVFLTELGEADPVLGVLGSGEVRVQTGHGDSVLAPPEGLEVLARSAGPATQVFRVNGGRFYSTQFHPDLTAVEAQERYDALYQIGEGASVEPPEAPNALFESGADASTVLLAQLVETSFFGERSS
jgi:GMP synthase (glutamine-hydrolysing)